MAIYINGKRVDDKPSKKKPVKVVDRVAAGEVFSYSGDVTITGDVEKGAIVDIKDGGLVVEGNVGDQAKIRVEQGQSNVVSGNVSISNISVSGSSNVVISSGGKTVFNSNASGENAHNGLTVHGNIGKNVTLVSDESVTLHGKVKDFFDVSAGHSVKADKADHTATFQSGHKTKIGQTLKP